MKKIALVLFIAILSAPALAWCDDIPRDVMVDMMRAALPKTLCEHPVYKKCFKVSTKDCLQTVGEIEEPCLSEASEKMPKKLKESALEEWGQKIGYCVGTAFVQKYGDRRVHSKSCDHPPSEK